MSGPAMSPENTMKVSGAHTIHRSIVSVTVATQRAPGVLRADTTSALPSAA